ncbi:hypothetical protein [Arthrobacter crusticola]|uniref:hypothetical protein n=1 Tax=Arthrobacter crusticola TaxID=2547960 RepID=UPI001404A108|nr:hypothetical protein [Arthrobacter crusticola]
MVGLVVVIVDGDHVAAAPDARDEDEAVLFSDPAAQLVDAGVQAGAGMVRLS